MLYVDIEKALGRFTLKVKFETGNEALGLLGASGCGKTMTLKCIAGVEKPDKGRIVLDDKVLFDSEKHINLPPQERRTGYLFQQYALFPNMSVAQNIACGIRGRMSKADKQKTVAGIIKKIHLSGLEDKKPGQLSGGQQQRAALARILVGEPDILMLDEPFSALDSYLKFQLEQEIRDTIKEFGKTVLIVSHNRDELYRLANNIAIMKNGRIETIGSVHEIFDHPLTANGAVMTGCKNVAPCQSKGPGKVYVPNWDITLKIPDDADEVTAVGMRMHDLHIGEGENVSSYDVVEEIENPFSFTIMIRNENNPESVPIGIELPKEEWYNNRAAKLRVYIAPEDILLLKD